MLWPLLPQAAREIVSYVPKPAAIDLPDAVKPGESEGTSVSAPEPEPVPDTPGADLVTSPQHAEVPSEPVRDSRQIDMRLTEIEQRLAQLDQATEFASQPAPTAEIQVPDPTEITRQFDLRHHELEHRGEQLAVEAERLHDREERVAERESHLNGRRQELAHESERIAAAAQVARDALAAEHALHLATWQKWDATYAQLSAAMTSKSEAIEQQRVALQAESDRLGTARADLQRAQAELERARTSLSADQSRLAKDRAQLAALKFEFDDQRQRQQRETDEREALIQSGRLQIALQQSELLAAQQELERERQRLLAERTAQRHEIDRIGRNQLELQAKFDHVRQHLETEREEMRCLTEELKRTQTELQDERRSAVSSHQQTEESQRELQEFRIRSQAMDLEVAELRSQLNELRLKQSARPTVADRVEILTTSSVDERLPAATPAAETAEASADAATETAVIAAEPAISSSVAPSRSTDSGDAASESQVEIPAVTWEFPASISTAVPPAIPLEPPPLPVEFCEVGVTRGASESRMSDSHAQDPEVEWPLPSGPDGERDPFPDFNRYSFGAVGSPTEGDALSSLPSTGGISTWPATESGLGAGIPVEFGADPWANIPVSREGAVPYQETTPANIDVGRPVDPWATPVVSDSRYSAVNQEHRQFDGSYPALHASTIEPNESEEDYSILEQLMNHRSPQVQRVDETLDAINRDFGVPVDETQPESTPALPSWWDEKSPASDSAAPSESGHPNWVVEALRSSPTDTDIETSEPPASDLRSQLAMLFDLPASALEAKTEETATAQTDECDLVQAEEPSASHRDAPEPAQLPAETSQAASPESTSSEPEEQSGGDSVDEFMARLLARSRTSASDMANKSSNPAPVAPQPVPQAEPEILTHAASLDRSHLMAEPKHKQNKQAVRENLQSFRQVAHLSARSALARHSLQQVRNATIAKGILLGVSAAYGTIFLTDPLWGNPFQMWKAGACVLATILSGMEARRSWKQLRNLLGPKPDYEVPPSNDATEVTAALTPPVELNADAVPSPTEERNPEPQ